MGDQDGRQLTVRVSTTLRSVQVPRDEEAREALERDILHIVFVTLQSIMRDGVECFPPRHGH